MSSSTTRSRLIYLAFAGLGGSAAYYRRSQDNEAAFHGFPDFTEHHNMLARHLTKRMYQSMRRIRTPSGYTLDRCIQPGVDNPSNALSGGRDPGIVAGDIECYELFSDLFDPVVFELHERAPAKKSLSSFVQLDPQQAEALQFNPKVVLDVTAKVYRNLSDFPFTPAVTRGQRRLIEGVVRESLPPTLAQGYQSLEKISQADAAKYMADGIPVTKPTSTTDSVAKVNRDWPDARGLVVTSSRDTIVQVNGRHHIEIASNQPNGNLGKVLNNLATQTQALEANLAPVTYQWSQKYGYVGHDPKEIGNGLSLEATLKMPHVSEQYSFLTHLKELGLKPLDHPLESEGYWRVALRPGFATETDQVARFAAAINTLVKTELEASRR